MKTIQLTLLAFFLFPYCFSTSAQNAAYHLNRDFQKCGSKAITPPYLVDSDVLSLADGRTMVVNDLDSSLLFYRLKTSLWSDTSFGVNGFKSVKLPFPVRFKSATATNTHIYVAGSRKLSAEIFRAALFRIDLNGNLDTSFNHTGWVEDNLALGTGYSEYYHLAPMADGRIVVLGALTVVDASFQKSSKMILRRYRKNGTLDPNFHPSGLHTTPTMLNDFMYGNGGMEVDQKQTRFFASICNSGYDCPDVFVAGFDSLGAFSPLVGGTGLSMIQMGTVPYQRIKVFRDGNNIYGASANFVFRTNLNGVLDNGFGTGGIATIPSFQANQMLTGMLKEPTGKILAYAMEQGGSNSYLARIKTNGRLDSTFGLNGVQTLAGTNKVYHIQSSGNNLRFLNAQTVFFGGLSEWQPKPYRIKLVAKPSDTICNNVQGIIKALRNPNCNAIGRTWFLNGTAIPDILPDSVPMSSPGVYQMKTNIQVGIGSVEVLSDSITIKAVNITIPVITQNAGVLSVPTQTGAQYQWLLNGVPVNGANGNTYTPSQPGVYTVKVSKGTCFRISSGFTITENDDLLSSNLVYQLIPNPAHDLVFLNVPEINRGKYAIQVLSLQGKEMGIQASWARNGDCQLNVRSLPSGVYHVVLSTEKFRGVKRLMVSH